MTRSTPARQRLEAWGYRVTTRGGWVHAAGHGAWHRWHGWRQVPADTHWRLAVAWSTAADSVTWGVVLSTPPRDRAWATAGTGAAATSAAADLWARLLSAAHAFGVTTVRIVGDVRLVHLWTRPARLAGLRGLTVVLTLGHDAGADALRRTVAPLRFDPARLERRGAQWVAHGADDYLVDPVRGTCTCPAWRFGRRPCKHLAAAAGH